METKDKYQLVGRCGIFCGTDCEVYEATHSSDVEKKNRVAKALERELGIAVDPSSLRCEGCQGPEESMVRMSSLSHPAMWKKAGNKNLH